MREAALCADWLAPAAWPLQTPLLCLMGERHSADWYVCVQLHQGYFYLDPDASCACSLRHCAQRMESHKELQDRACLLPAKQQSL